MKLLEPKAERWWVRLRLGLAFIAIVVVVAAFVLPDWQYRDLAIRLALVALIVSQLIPDLFAQFSPSGLQPKVFQRIEMACHGWRNEYLGILGGDRQETDQENTWEDLQHQPTVENTREEYGRYLPLFKDAIPRYSFLHPDYSQKSFNELKWLVMDGGTNTSGY